MRHVSISSTLCSFHICYLLEIHSWHRKKAVPCNQINRIDLKYINFAVKDTSEISYFDPPIAWIALLCSLLLGFGDACINTQIYTMLAGAFASNSVAAFAVFKFTQVSRNESTDSHFQVPVFPLFMLIIRTENFFFHFTIALKKSYIFLVENAKLSLSTA